MSIFDEILAEVATEIRSAIEKHPRWPVDIVHGAAIVAEECGELQRAALRLVYEGGSRSDVKGEAIQTAATALRFLVALRLFAEPVRSQRAHTAFAPAPARFDHSQQPAQAGEPPQVNRVRIPDLCRPEDIPVHLSGIPSAGILLMPEISGPVSGRMADPTDD